MTKVIQFLIIGVLLIMSALYQNQAHAQTEKLSLEIVDPTELYDPTPNGYSHVIVVKGASATAYL